VHAMQDQVTAMVLEHTEGAARRMSSVDEIER
jgi:hypothetical protein